MDEIGGQELTVVDDSGRMHLCTVAHADKAEAMRLALAHVGAGKVKGGTELWASDIAALGMQPNQVRSATVVKSERKG